MSSPNRKSGKNSSYSRYSDRSLRLALPGLPWVLAVGVVLWVLDLVLGWGWFG